ncbi:MAG TPA: hypothetical protein VKJ07_12750 [Mycobacteriales bacterium]|nr:hypothetical protein [Mycobacteriales bacterium]
MFAAYCQTHQAEVLLSPRNIDALHNTDAGIEIEWTCRCGQHGATLTGRSRRAEAPAAIEVERAA